MSNGWGSVLALAIVLSLWSLSPGISRSKVDEHQILEEELILGLYIRRQMISEALLAYNRDGQVLLPLQELGFLLEFPIFVDADGQGAEGWFLQEARKIRVDLTKSDAVVEGRKVRFDARYVVPVDGELYVSTDILSHWLPLEFEIDLSNSAVTIQPLEPLPSEIAAERAKRQAGVRRSVIEDPAMDLISLPYRAIDLPALDIGLDFGVDSKTGKPQVFYSTVASNDLLWMNSTALISGSDDSIDLFRLNLARRDPEAQLLGPLRATRLEFGDIGSPSRELFALAEAGRGVSVGNFPLGYVNEFDRVTLQGDLPTNFEVELYRNDQLIDFQSLDVDGRYVFDSVPLLVGLNNLRMVFYGPNGQRYERVEPFFIGPGLVPPGTLHYQVSAMQQALSLFELEDNVSRRDPDEESSGKARLLAEAEYGLNHKLSLNAAVGSIPLDDEPTRRYGAVGLRASLLGTFASLDVAVDDESGQAYHIGGQRIFGPVSVSLSHDRFRAGFVSEVRGNGTLQLQHQSEARATTRLPDVSVARNPFLDVDVGYSKFTSGRKTIDAGVGLSNIIQRLSISNRLGVEHRTGGGLESQDALVGDLNLGGRVGSLSLRGGLDYEIAPVTEAKSIDLSMNYSLSDLSSFLTSVERELDLDETITYTARLNRDFNLARLGLVANYNDTDENLFVGASINFSTYYDRAVDRPRIVSETTARRGMALPRAFLDLNANGSLDPEEPPLPGVEFNVRGYKPDARTGQNGEVTLTKLPIHRPLEVEVRPESLESPYWQPVAQKLQIVPRPGRVAMLDMAVVPTAEVEGTVTLLRGSNVEPAGNVSLQIVDTDDGRVAAETRSEYDGFYIFEGVTPGLYLLRVDPNQRTRLGLADPAPRILVIGPETELIQEQDFHLKRQVSGKVS